MPYLLGGGVGHGHAPSFVDEGEAPQYPLLHTCERRGTDAAWMTHGALCVLVARVTTRGRYIKIIAALNETLRYNRKRLCKPSSEFRFPAFAKLDLGIWHPFGICQSACKCLCNTPRVSNDT